jgi:hypothetical protein
MLHKNTEMFIWTIEDYLKEHPDLDHWYHKDYKNWCIKHGYSAVHLYDARVIAKQFIENRGQTFREVSPNIVEYLSPARRLIDLEKEQRERREMRLNSTSKQEVKENGFE